MLKPLSLLGELSPAQFLADYWQKKPLLIRQAIPNFKGLLTPNELAGLACEEDSQARLISQSKGKWQVKHGPFDDADFAKLPKENWTLLVQNINHILPLAADLLAQFNFIPHARLDDLMVSYAPAGGGVGAHVDSYDVFLLQGTGTRNWKIETPKIGTSKPLSLLPDAPLKIISNFEATDEWELEAGDMLYLPPQIAHWGISKSDDCMTYSIGFRAPKTQELTHEFLGYLQDNLQLDGLYADPDLTLQTHPAEISSAMISKVSEKLQKITWDDHQVADFLGKYLTEPKQHIVFDAPKKLSLDAFLKRFSTAIVSLDLKSQMLFFKDCFYLNGEHLMATSGTEMALKKLADRRQLSSADYPAQTLNALANILHPAYLAGYIILE